MKTVYLSLGSNLGDRAGRLREALRLLEEGGLRVRRISPVYETEPQDVRDQPWFLNLVAEVETELFPRQMLARIQSIEWKMGRRRSKPKGPREIDIDVLLYGSMVLRMPELTVPHPRMSERRFVLQPLADLAPELKHPVSGRTILELLAEIRGQTVRQVGALPYEAGNTGGDAGVS
ncbi:MAG: 2-amino-4-hydroxy-6-hydroxymethyldihydropteridine diphosphokinase [Bryobacteraceae bacterium]|nr:2-amino-4-hydroxy-6-hydroxymethyldihydropteridine diphosphokinase [Bryobacteraceae bacterium]